MVTDTIFDCRELGLDFFYRQIGLYRGSEVTMGSENPLQNFLNGIFVQEGSSRTRFDQGQFQIKTFSI